MSMTGLLACCRPADVDVSCCSDSFYTYLEKDKTVILGERRAKSVRVSRHEPLVGCGGVLSRLLAHCVGVIGLRVRSSAKGLPCSNRDPTQVALTAGCAGVGRVVWPTGWCAWRSRAIWFVLASFVRSFNPAAWSPLSSCELA